MLEIPEILSHLKENKLLIPILIVGGAAGLYVAHKAGSNTALSGGSGDTSNNGDVVTDPAQNGLPPQDIIGGGYGGGTDYASVISDLENQIQNIINDQAKSTNDLSGQISGLADQINSANSGNPNDELNGLGGLLGNLFNGQSYEPFPNQVSYKKPEINTGNSYQPHSLVAGAKLQEKLNKLANKSQNNSYIKPVKLPKQAKTIYHVLGSNKPQNIQGKPSFFNFGSYVGKSFASLSGYVKKSSPAVYHSAAASGKQYVKAQVKKVKAKSASKVYKK